MTIRKNDENSEFWQDVKEAAQRAAAFPAWKRGILLKKASSDDTQSRTESAAVPDSVCTEGL